MYLITLLSVCMLLFNCSIVFSQDTNFKFVLDERGEDSEIIVTEFLDTSGTGFGRALSYLIWRELLGAIGDHTGSEVVLLRIKEDKRIERLKGNANHLALEIAQDRQASMILWGEVRPNEKNFQVKTFLALNTSRFRIDKQFLQRLKLEPIPKNILRKLEFLEGHDFKTEEEFLSFLTKKIGEFQTGHYKALIFGAAFNSKAFGHNLDLNLLVGDNERKYEFHATISSKKFYDFVEQEVNRDQLFANRLITRTPSVLYTQLKQEPIPAGIELYTQDMYVNSDGAWFWVTLPDGRTSYINGDHVFIVPEYISNTTNKAISHQKSRDPKNKNGEKYQEALPKLAIQFTLPVQYFIVGLSYYQSRRFEDAYLAFKEFIDRRKAESLNESNYTMSSAYKWKGTSLIFKNDSYIGNLGYLDDFYIAKQYAPQDTETMHIHNVARLGIMHQIDQNIQEGLRQIFEIDKNDAKLRDFIHTLAETIGDGTLEPPEQDWLRAAIGIVSIIRDKSGYINLPYEPQKVQTARNANGVYMDVANHSDYKLNLYILSDPNNPKHTSHNIELEAHAKQDNIELDEGQYEIGVKLSSQLGDNLPPIRPRYGLQYFDLDTRYQMNFYVDWRGNN